MQSQAHDLLKLLHREHRSAATSLTHLVELGQSFTGEPNGGYRADRTVTEVTPTRSAIWELATPCPAINNTVARCTCRWAAVEDLAKTANASR